MRNTGVHIVPLRNVVYNYWGSPVGPTWFKGHWFTVPPMSSFDWLVDFRSPTRFAWLNCVHDTRQNLRIVSLVLFAHAINMISLVYSQEAIAVGMGWEKYLERLIDVLYGSQVAIYVSHKFLKLQKNGKVSSEPTGRRWQVQQLGNLKVLEWFLESCTWVCFFFISRKSPSVVLKGKRSCLSFYCTSQGLRCSLFMCWNCCLPSTTIKSVSLILSF